MKSFTFKVGAEFISVLAPNLLAAYHQILKMYPHKTAVNVDHDENN